MPLATNFAKTKAMLPFANAVLNEGKIEAKYMISKENWHLQIAGGYNSFNV